MTTVGVRELSHHTSRYLAQVRAGRTLAVTEHGRVIAVLSPATDRDGPRRRRPRIGGYRSAQPLTAEEIDAELARGFGLRTVAPLWGAPAFTLRPADG